MQNITLQLSRPLKDGALYTFKGGNLIEIQTGPQAAIPQPDPGIFRKASGSVEKHLLASPSPLYKLESVEYPEEKDGGGILRYMEGLKYPLKGFPYPAGCYANDIVKSQLISWVKIMAKNPLFAISFVSKRKFFTWLNSYTKFAYKTLAPHFLDDVRYKKAVREIRAFVDTFAKGAGHSKWWMLGIVFATMFELDDAYLLRIQDLANETTKDKMLKNPRREIVRLFGIFKEREERVGLHQKFGWAVSLLSYFIYVPWFKKCLMAGLRAVNWENLQMDEADRCFAMTWQKYNFFGKTLEDRHKQFVDLHDGNPPKKYLVQIDPSTA